MRGVVAAGHPVTAEAGADVLREGGNAVDAAVACVLMSFVAESPLTGPGAGGFMLVHTSGGEDHLLDFFVAAPGSGLDGREPAELTPIDIHFSDDAVQRFNVGPSSYGAYGTTLGLAQALGRFGIAARSPTSPRALPGRPARGSRWCPCRPSCSGCSSRSCARPPSARRSTRPGGGCSRKVSASASQSWATCSSAWGRRDPASSTPATWRRRAASGCSSAVAC